MSQLMFPTVGYCYCSRCVGLTFAVIRGFHFLNFLFLSSSVLPFLPTNPPKMKEIAQSLFSVSLFLFLVDLTFFVIFSLV